MTGTTDSNRHSRIEDYLQGKLNEKQFAEFEMSLFEDSELAREVELHQSLKRAMKRALHDDLRATEESPQSPGWWQSLRNNSALAWLVAGGCAAGLLFSVSLRQATIGGFAISDEVSIQSYRGGDSTRLQSKLSTRAADAYVLLTIDSPFINSKVQLTLNRTETQQKYFSIHSDTDEYGTAIVVLHASIIPKGSTAVTVETDNGESAVWTIEFQ